MTYPLSSEVNVGDATEAAQYNNLRMDAVYLGADPTAAGTVKDLLTGQLSALEFARVSGTTIRLTASEDEPAAVMIGEQIYAVKTNQTVMITVYDCPEKGRYYIYATPGSAGGFTIGAGAAAPSGSRVIGTFLWSGTGVIPGTVEDIRRYRMNQGSRDRKQATGRLTLASGTPVPDTDIVSAETLYYTPYNGNETGLKIGTEWELFEYAELSASLSGLQRELPYDVFLTVDENGPRLELSAWGSRSARLSGLVYAEGVPVSVTDPGMRYLGTIAVNAAGYGEDSKRGRLVWNYNNRKERTLLAVPPDTVTTAKHQNKWAPYYGDDAPEVRLLLPLGEAELDLKGTGLSSTIAAEDRGYSRGAAVGICQDMEMSDPYTGNASIVPVFAVTYGNGPVTVELRNSGTELQGYHRYTLAFWTNYEYFAAQRTLRTASGENHGLYGMVRG